jgi:hypothetical protein
MMGERLGKIRVVEDPDTPAIDIHYSQRTIRAQLPVDFKSATIHLNRGLYAHAGGERALAADGLAVMAWLFYEGLKADHTAADLIGALAPYSLVLFESDFPRLVMMMLEDCGRDDVFELLQAEERRRS